MSHDLLDASWDEAPEERRPGRRTGLVALLGVILVLAAAYVAAAWWFGDRVPRGTTVAGVAVGGQSAGEARSTLTAAFADDASAPLTLDSRAGEVRLTPQQLGVAVDVDATVESLTGFSLAPVDLWRHLVGGSDGPAVVRVDEGAFTAALDGARAELDRTPEEGSLSVAGGTVQYTAPVPGLRVDVARTAEAVRRQWPEDRTVDVVAEGLPPKVPASEFERVRTEFAQVAVSAPVTVRAGQTSFTLDPATFGPAVVLTPDAEGRITPRADAAKLTALVHAAARRAGAERDAQDATATFAGLTPTVRDAVPGVRLDDASITSAVWAAIAGTERTATVSTAPVEPTWTTEKVTATLPTEKISSFTTYFPCCQSRVKNIQKGASVVDGTYVLPGEQFSLNDVLGDTTTAASGYTTAGIILYGRLVEAYGGGLSQVSTTVFNAAFFAGVRLDAWTPHAYYISRYPEGREATISYPNVHHKWTNTTDGGILIRASTTDTSITVTFYGTKTWDVTATKSARYNIVQPKKIIDDSPKCLPQSPVEGFTVDVGRVFAQGGKVVRTEKFTTRYQPEDDVVCTYWG